ncbi:hypothetical protein GCM10020218_024640 [Dactylosporangium vinaceum]
MRHTSKGSADGISDDLASLSVAVSQLAVGAFVDRIDPRVLIAACGAVTLLYSGGWALVALRRPPEVEVSRG